MKLSLPRRWARRIIAGLSALAAMSTLASATTPSETVRAEREFREVLARASRRHHLPGISVAIATHQGVVWVGTVGSVDAEGRRPANAAYLYGIGSITKTFVACIAERLMDQGMLQEEQRIAELLPPETLRGITNGESATVGQLLNHSSGIATWEFDSRWITKGRGYAQNPDHLWTPIEPLEFIRGDGHPATNAAGQGYAYSNTNFTLLGLIIERVTGRPLVELLHEQIFNPLGLMDIRMEGFEPIDPKRVPPRYHYNTPEFRDTAGISPYYRNLGTLLDVSRSNLSTEWAAGGLMATPRDLAAFTLALRDGRVVPRTTLARMLRFRPTDAPDEEVGAGIFREQLADGWLDGYDGGVLGFGAVMGWVEGDDIVLALSTNVGMMHAGDKSFYPLQLVRSPSFMAALRKFAHALTPSGG